MTIKDIQENLKLNCSSKTKKMIIELLKDNKSITIAFEYADGIKIVYEDKSVLIIQPNNTIFHEPQDLFERFDESDLDNFWLSMQEKNKNKSARF